MNCRQIDTRKPTNGDASALIVFSDLEACKSLEVLTTNLGITAVCQRDSQLVIDLVGEKFYNVILLDVAILKNSGADLVSEIMALSPDSRVILIVGNSDRRTAIEAVKRGVFDFLEKPVELPLLSLSIRRALDTQRTELEFKQTCGDLQVYKTELERLSKELTDTNTALSVLAKNIDGTRQKVEREIVSKMRSFILPIIEKLQQEHQMIPYRAELSALIDYVEDLTSTQGNGKKIAMLLSTSELRIATLIKNGLTTQAIADHLCISPGTVKSHRKNIRKKLGINGYDRYLGDYLRTELDQGEELEEGLSLSTSN
jgi:FixJ family two-component response regulator